jgi:hypothetical protein
MLVEHQFSIRVKLNNYEIEIAGTREEVLKTLDGLSKIIQKVAKAFEESIGSVEIKFKEKVPIIKEKFPTIPKPSGCADAIIKLLSTDWGHTPRTWRELKEAMEVNAIYYSKGSITGQLTYLTQKKTIRRIKTERGYAYILVD